MPNGTIEERIAWRYDRARALGLDILKLLLNTTVVIAAVPIVFHSRLEETFPGPAMWWVHLAWSLMLGALVLGLTTFLLVFEGDYHAAHGESDRAHGSIEHAQRMENKSNFLFDVGHVLGILTGIAFTLGIACVVIAIWIRKPG